MAAVSRLDSLRDLLREQGLGSALPVPSSKRQPPATTGFEALDALLDGGIPRGHITELVGKASSGRTSVAFALLAEATGRGEVTAYIDASDSLDPRSAQKAGIALERLLWVRCGVATGAPACPPERSGGAFPTHEAQPKGDAQQKSMRQAAPLQGNGFPLHADGSTDQPINRVTAHVPTAQPLSGSASPFRFPKSSKNDPAWQAVNLVASAGGFGVIVLDLGGISKRKLREWQGRQWLRLRRAIEHSPTSLVIVAGEHLASTVSALVLELSREKSRWQGTPGVSLWLSGISTKVRIMHQRKNPDKRKTESGEEACYLGIGE